ncbi:MAG: hypothetical protein ABI207_09760 [Crocinitomicaceae bacterium]
MKKSILFLLVLPFATFAQQTSKDLIPSSAFVAVGVNSPVILKSASVEEIQRYEFMNEVMKDLFGEKYAGKNLGNIGVDFSQSLYYFYGLDSVVNYFGICFKANDIKTVEKWSRLDEKEIKKSKQAGWVIKSDKYNYFLTKGDLVVMLNIRPDYGIVFEEADKLVGAEPEYPEIWEDNGYGDTIMTYDYSDDAIQQKYWERRDKVEDSLSNIYKDIELKRIITDLNAGKTLIKSSATFAKLSASSNATFIYYDLEKTIRSIAPNTVQKELGNGAYDYLMSLYEKYEMNFTTQINDKSLSATLDATYNKKMGEILTSILDQKPSEKLMAVIPPKAIGTMVFNFNLEHAFDEANEFSSDLLSEKVRSSGVMGLGYTTWQVATEFIDKDKLFATFKGNIFATFNGLKKVKYTAIESDWNEETYEYRDTEVVRTDDFPVFTFGFATDRPEVLEKIISLVKKTADLEIEGADGNYVIRKAIIHALDLYLVNRNGVLVVTNDEEYRDNLINGTVEKLSPEKLAEITAAGNMYAEFDFHRFFPILDSVDGVKNSDRQLFAKLSELMGVFKVKTTLVSKNEMKVAYNYTFEQDKNGLHHILNVINTIYQHIEARDRESSSMEEGETKE